MTAQAPTAAQGAAAAGAMEATRERTGAPPAQAKAFADFHIHTRFSRDSILSEEKFIRIAVERGLTHVAVTNHNNVEGAVAVRDKVAELGLTDRLTVILGEEVSTADGEVVGLFLQRTIPRGLSADETADAIHEQGGLVSIPHPYDPFRQSHIREEPLIGLLEAGKVDMIEVFNSRVTLAAPQPGGGRAGRALQGPGDRLLGQPLLVRDRHELQRAARLRDRRRAARRRSR